ncbi:AP2 domain protein [Pseudomonas phage vB_Paer_Ps25]|uniref:AP2/ERF domain-containing protein n=1 Tax=Pseudomonas phage vB_Paer_Ps12 TaxID=2924904 RepID=A0AAE9GRF3_9CAUD|nr:hypothetical protein QE347_gp168 [Pseudomonas phage vB_Paer_Ps12]UOL47624.1 hypothetical protein vBPaerPs12_168c [Pseudomonas phage vB_Paer_Ps12]UOL47811.1 AP2 domain protein [Pseudomonas phage vB_Paer_Ps25]
MAVKDLTGQTFTYLRVVGDSGARSNSREVLWLCECICGAILKIRTGALKVGDNKSCGCMQSKLLSSHGMYGTPTYNSWRTMIDRCTNPKHKSYKYYKDVTIDPKWKTFEGFYEDMGERPEKKTLDRKDSTKGYCKSNCRWATDSEQQQNKPASTRNTNGYPGIFFRNNRYVARIRYEGKRIYLGCYKTAEEAHKVYDDKGKELFGEEWKSYFDVSGQKR